VSAKTGSTGPTDPLYIIGTERSGSNLLRVILNAHPDIDVPHPPHILKYFHALEPGYGDLNQTRPRRALVRDVLRLLAVHIYPWSVDIDAQQVIDTARPANLLGIFAAIYDQHRAQTGKRRWGCKSTFMVHHIAAALQRDPGAKFIWLVRDPRDVALSSRASVFSPFHPLFTAELWDTQQREALAALVDHPEAILRVHYEDLIGDLEPTLRRVTDFLGEELHPDMLAHHRSAAAKKGAGLSESWKNTGAPVVRTNAGKYRTGLSSRHISLVEMAAGETMTTLGYSLDGPPCTKPGPLRRPGFALQDTAWQLAVELRSVFKDANHWRRWGRAVLMAILGWRRAGA
jgi:hypothetical protein